MPEVPSLVTLCIKAIKDAILDEDDNLPYVYRLPAELFDQILPVLPALALQNLQDAMPSFSSSDNWFSDDCLNPSRKRKRTENFDIAWKTLYQSRWPVAEKSSASLVPKDVQYDEATTDWQQIYWDKHLQNCLDATSETLAITLFDGYIGDVEIPDTLVISISSEGHVWKSRSYFKFSYHLERFGVYARCLRLQSVHCVAEIGSLLRNSRLEFLEVNWLKSKGQVEGLCKLLEQNKETLTSVEFINWKLPANLVSAICNSLHVKGSETSVIKSFSVKRSSILDSSHFPLPLGMESLLEGTSRNLTSLTLSDNHMWWKTAKLVFDILLETESRIKVLDLSENNIAGWLSHFKWRSDLQINKYLNSLRVLNLRSNNLHKDDVDCLKRAMVYMPKLEILDLSENPIQDDGIRILIRYLVEKSKSDTPLVELHVEHCTITRVGGRRLIRALASLPVPLKSLSIGDNSLSSETGTYLGRLLRSGIQEIDVNSTGLGSSGLFDAQKEIRGELSLVSINISGNKGGIRAPLFLSKVIAHAPKLISVKASNNWIFEESLPTIISCIKASNGKLEVLDLQQNPLGEKPEIASILAEFQINGKPNILISSPTATLYDNDP